MSRADGIKGFEDVFFDVHVFHSRFDNQVAVSCIFEAQRPC